jgi:hypothetical protein
MNGRQNNKKKKEKEVGEDEWMKTNKQTKKPKRERSKKEQRSSRQCTGTSSRKKLCLLSRLTWHYVAGKEGH